ncbi:MAG: DUF3035 domain-containing protein [Pseudomonadota bacterium]
MTQRIILLACTLMALTACDRRPFDPSGVPPGIPDRSPIADAGPDEFLIIENEPLDRPTTLDGPLPAPNANASSRVTPDPERNIALLLSGRAPNPATGNGASLLTAIGAERTPPGIRDVIEQEYQTEMTLDGGLITTLIGGPLFNPYAGDRLDAQAESERLQALYPNAEVTTNPAETGE